MRASALHSDRATLAALIGLCMTSAPAHAAQQPQFSAPVLPSESFPDPQHATRKEGVFLPPETIRLIAPGMTKRQVYALLGVPHFHEALFGERTWDFILNFYTGTGTEYIICQYQLHFGQDRRLDSVAWNSEACSQVSLPTVAPALAGPDLPKPAADPTAAPIRLTISFDFAYASLSQAAAAQLDQFAASIKDRDGTISVVGHTDRAGSEAYNDALGLARARTVAEALVARGVSRDRLNISGRGERAPIVDTPDGMPEARNRISEVAVIF
jgi:OmpA-OmpF porin, OOP family